MSIRTRAVRTVAVAACAAMLAAGAIVASSDASASATPGVSLQLVWEENVNSGSIAFSSPIVGTLDDGGPAAIVGSRSGYLYALHLSDGSAVAGWPARTGGIPIDSTPSVLGSGSSAKVYVGVGNAATFHSGGFYRFSSSGDTDWVYRPKSLPGGTGTVAVIAGVTLGDLEGGGKVDAVAGALGQLEYAFSTDTGKPLPGFPWLTADTVFSTAAVADLNGDGRDEIIGGNDATTGVAYYKQYTGGGYLRILRPAGSLGKQYINQGLVCERHSTQVLQASPAVGPILTRGDWGIVYGTGLFYRGASDTTYLMAVNSSCQQAWKTKLDGATLSSPALADVLGNGVLNVVEEAHVSNTATTVWALSGRDGSAIWHTPLPGVVWGAPVTADLGDGHQDVFATTSNGLFVLDGQTGEQLAQVTGVALQNAPLITDDANGTIGVTIAGNRGGHGYVAHYEITGSNGSRVADYGGWPMFHHDPHLTGAIVGSSRTVVTRPDVPCEAPLSAKPIPRGIPCSR